MGARTFGNGLTKKAPLVRITPEANAEGGSVRWSFRKPLTKLDADARRQALVDLAEGLRAVADDVEQGSLESGEGFE